jgi:hypothetical protein
MDLERDDYYRNLQYLHDKCKKCMSFHVIITMTDGNVFDGIIEDVDSNRVTALIGEDVMEQEDENQSENQRQPFGHGRHRRRHRRFRRRHFPLSTLAALSLLPYPYYAPLYPYFYPF